MRPSEIKKEIKNFFTKLILWPLHLEGSPGLGKTDLPQQVAKELGIGCKVIHVPLLQPEDYGFPVISPDKTTVRFVVSKELFPIEGSDCPEKGILVLDEAAQGDASAQKIIANIVRTRKVHSEKIKDGWTIVTTGNRTIDRAGANRLLSHFGNRITRVTVDVSLDDWTNWALENGVRTEVISFLRFRPELLNAFDAQSDINATPRSWAEGVSAILEQSEPSNEFELFKGTVGEGPAAEFSGFLKIYRKLPSPDSIILNPEKTEVPKDGATLYALCGALTQKVDASNFMRIMKYMSRCPAQFGLLFVRDAIKICPEVQTTKDFISWASKDGAKLLAN